METHPTKNIFTEVIFLQDPEIKTHNGPVDLSIQERGELLELPASEIPSGMPGAESLSEAINNGESA